MTKWKRVVGALSPEKQSLEQLMERLQLDRRQVLNGLNYARNPHNIPILGSASEGGYWLERPVRLDPRKKRIHGPMQMERVQIIYREPYGKLVMVEVEAAERRFRRVIIETRGPGGDEKAEEFDEHGIRQSVL